MRVATTLPVKSKGIDLAGLGLISFTGLNLNAVAAKFLGQEEMLSPLALAFTLILLLRYARPHGVRDIYVLFALTIFIYLFMGSSATFGKAPLNFEYIKLYLTSFVLVSAIYFWIVAQDEAGVLKALTLYKYILLLACLSTVLSDVLRPFEVPQAVESMDAPQLEEQGGRAAGFFENPNEAASVALYALVMIVALPAKRVLWRWAQIGLALLALLMTFSKAAMLGLMILTVGYVVTRKSLATMLLVLIVAMTGVLALWFVYEHDLLNLSWDQRERLADVLNLAGGEISARTTTGRSVLVQFGLEKIGSVFPWGAGLGEFHAMTGGIRKISDGMETTRWLGIHNTYLMMLGEGGLIALLMLLTLLFSLFIAGSRSHHRMIVWGFTIVFMIQMASSHHVFLLRFADTALALAVALASLAPKRKMVENPPGRTMPHTLVSKLRT